MSEKKILSVIIPGRNQGDSLGKTIDDIAKHAKTLTDYEVELVYDDGHSSDDSIKIAESKKDLFKHFQIVSDPPEARGKGFGIQYAMSKAKGDLKMFMDADNSTNFREIDKLLPYIDKYEVVMGTRYSNNVSTPETNWFKAFWRAFVEVIQVIIFGHAKSYTAKVKQGRFRQFISRGGNLAFTVLLGQSFSDTRCGFKLYTREAADKIFPILTIGTWDFDTEVLVLAKKFGYKVIEVPVVWYDDAGETNFGMKAMLDSFVAIFKIRLNLLKGVYNKQKASS